MRPCAGWYDKRRNTFESHPPPVVHYNGGISHSRVDWMEGFTAGVFLRHIAKRCSSQPKFTTQSCTLP